MTSARVDRSLARLTDILPLAEKLAGCDEAVCRLYRHILHGFAEQGRAPSREAMATLVDAPAEALAELDRQGLVVLDAGGQVRGAYPFTTELREHRVSVNGHRVYAMCALDALAVAPMFEVPVAIVSRCRVSGDAVEIRQSGGCIENLAALGDVHLGIDWGAVTADVCCADSLCLQMLYLRGGDVAQQWLAEAPENREVFTLPEAVELASRFFVPLLR